MIRSHVILHKISYTTTITGAQATVNGIETLLKNKLEVTSLQEFYRKALRTKKRNGAVN